MKEEYDSKLTITSLERVLGPIKFDRDRLLNNNMKGVATGLAWTRVGGDILFIETSLSKGKGDLTITGNLGNVMKESATIALEYLKANANTYELDVDVFQKWNVHIHVPEGATPKDGPSAGIGMVTSIISAITEIPVDKNVAMTGEITLRGIILPIGGLKEKLLAAHRAGIKKVLIPMENKKDLVEVPETILKTMTIVPVKNVDEVLKIALTKPLKRVEWVDVDQISDKNKSKKELSTH